ncbi:MAG: acyl carrier [Prolixibacteraceae bacterium]|nr:MAG: acyl carrier [Prolixibacteraceae bacterium]
MDIIISQIEQLRNFISEITFSDIDKIQDDTLLFEEGIFDSLGFLSLVSFLNEEYGVEVTNDELSEDNFKSIKAIVEYIAKKQNSRLD